eukprot:5834926-Pleurochrysis_carterae.AAC.1
MVDKLAMWMSSWHAERSACAAGSALASVRCLVPMRPGEQAVTQKGGARTTKLGSCALGAARRVSVSACTAPAHACEMRDAAGRAGARAWG